jgi:hypothetical protein
MMYRGYYISVKYISALSRVTFASGSVLKRIGKGAFSGCEELGEIEIPACVEVDDSLAVRIRRTGK